MMKNVDKLMKTNYVNINFNLTYTFDWSKHLIWKSFPRNLILRSLSSESPFVPDKPRSDISLITLNCFSLINFIPLSTDIR